MEKALSDIQASLRINSRQSLAYAFRGQAYYQLGVLASTSGDTIAAATYYSRAIRECQKALSVKANTPEAYLYMGMTMVQRNKGDDKTAASNAYSKALEINNTYAEAWYYRGVLKPVMPISIDYNIWLVSAIEDLTTAVWYAPGTPMAQRALEKIDTTMPWYLFTNPLSEDYQKYLEEYYDVLQAIAMVAGGTPLGNKAQNLLY